MGKRTLGSGARAAPGSRPQRRKPPAPTPAGPQSAAGAGAFLPPDGTGPPFGRPPLCSRGRAPAPRRWPWTPCSRSPNGRELYSSIPPPAHLGYREKRAGRGEATPVAQPPRPIAPGARRKGRDGFRRRPARRASDGMDQPQSSTTASHAAVAVFWNGFGAHRPKAAAEPAPASETPGAEAPQTATATALVGEMPGAEARTCRCGHVEPERRPKWCPRCGREWRLGERTAWDAAEDFVDGVGRWFSDALARRDRAARRTAALCVVFGGLAVALGFIGTAIAVAVAAFV